MLVAPMSEVDLFEEHPGEAAGTIAIPMRDAVKAQTMVSLLNTDYSFAAPKHIKRLFLQGNILTLQRNEAVQRMEGDWLLFVDDDMVWAPDAIGRLVATQRRFGLDMVGGLCFRRTPPFAPTLYLRESETEGGYHNLETWLPDEVVEVDATGMAFMLITRKAIETITGILPPLHIREQMAMPALFEWRGLLGEDLAFCQLAKAHGLRVWVDTAVEVGHLAEVEIRYRHFLQEVANRPEAVDAAHREVAEKFGVGHLTPEEARAKLRGEA